MDAARVVHIVAGSVGLLSGYTALFAAKGAATHRKAGLVFVASMLVMTVTGGGITLLEGVAVRTNLPAALLTACLVVSALATVRPPARGAAALHLGVMLVTLAVGLSSLALGVRVVATGVRPDGMPPFPYFLFGTVGTLAAWGDLRIVRSGPLTGSRRLRRHLWRMGFALFIAALSFFIGQADELPPAIRVFPVLVLPVLTVLFAMIYWSWRMRRRRVAGPVVSALERAALLALILAPAPVSAQGYPAFTPVARFPITDTTPLHRHPIGRGLVLEARRVPPLGWSIAVVADSGGPDRANLLYHSPTFHGPHPSDVFAWSHATGLFPTERLLPVAGHPVEIRIRLLEGLTAGQGDSTRFTRGTVEIGWRPTRPQAPPPP